MPGFRHPGTYPKKPGGFWVHPPKNPPPKTHTSTLIIILVYTLYATNNAIFYCFKAFKALSFWVFVLFYLFFLLLQKTPKPNKTHWVGLFKKTQVFWTLKHAWFKILPKGNCHLHLPLLFFWPSLSLSYSAPLCLPVQMFLAKKTIHNIIWNAVVVTYI